MSNFDKQEVFMFLDDLRSTGSTNMFFAAPYIEEVFGVDRRVARDLLKEWMKTFSERHA